METIIAVTFSVAVAILIFLRGYGEGYGKGIKDVLGKVGSIEERSRIMKELEEEKLDNLK